MNRSNICTFIVSTLIGIPAYVNAQQISPNPNPLDSTITIDASAENSVDFANIGVISITNPGSLSNYSPSKWYLVDRRTRRIRISRQSYERGQHQQYNRQQST